jgi:IclR family transcriptional regulator, acetate operon repressor
MNVRKLSTKAPSMAHPPRPARSVRSARAAPASAAPTAPTAPASSAERTLRLLQYVARNDRDTSVSEAAEALRLPKATVHRLCARLVADGFLVRDVDEHSYSAGPALRALAFDALAHGRLRALRHRLLAELVEDVRETCNFTTIDGARIVYLDRVEAQWPLRLTLDVGSHVPLHCTASGKLFLAMLPPPRSKSLIDATRLEASTPRTIVTARALADECERIRRAGHAEDREEFIAGLIAVAVPVLDAGGAIRAAIAMHAPVARVSMKEALRRLPRLRSAAQRMSALL